ncbi:MAG: allantoate amidohydrolase [Bacteroidota bacterium]|jgi:allantoate deiminase|nr:allantoate amidohydrolase [Bacteroidota bacterium]
MYELGTRAFNLLTEIAAFGKDPAGGETRFLYTDEWIQSQNFLKTTLESAGFKCNYDEVGNLFGKVHGVKYKDETILTGSHIDTVRNGGMYDGQFGIVASFLAINYLKEKYGPPLRNLELISFAEEEGSRFSYAFWGSKNLCKIAKKDDVMNLVDADGISFVKAMKDHGFNFRDESIPFREDIKAFLEIHIEQGKILETEKLDIGVVHAIAGQRRFNIEITGESNHAGTTPMGYRKDSVYAMSLMISYIIETARRYGDPLVATIGKIIVKPNTVNVVPGYTLFTLDTRHTDANVLTKFNDEIFVELEKIAKANKTSIKIDMWMNALPVPMNKNIVDVFEAACIENNFKHKIMHSGAGHDSMIIAPFVPTAMFFVPSVKGISHSPEEFTEIEYLDKGIRVLATALYKLAYV